jgi:hypothetical protein
MASITPISGTDFSTFTGGNYQAMRGIASSANGTIIYICMNGVANIGVVKSTNSGSSWNIVDAVTRSFTSICCSSNGQIVYAANLGDGLYKSTNSGSSWNQVTFSSNTLPGGAGNPESPQGGQFPGYDLFNIDQIACDSTGSKLIMTTNAAASIYQSIDGGVTWSFLYVTPGYITNPNSPTTIASNSDGSVLYVSLNNNSTKNIIVSKNSGATWASINMLGLSGPFTTLSTNSYGDFVFGVDNTSNLNIFYPTHIDKAVLIPGNGNTYSAIGCYNNGNNIIIAQNSYESIINGAVVLYSVTNKYPPGQPSVPCFKEDSKILCFKDGRETYVKIQDIRRGDLIKTVKHGYVPVNMIGTTKLYNSGNSLRGTHRLYLCSPDKYPELTDDLIITGCHSILKDTITEKQREGTIEILGRIFVTDNKYRIMACLDERALPYLEEGVFNIWHIALDNDNYYMNYGIYANGLLVETCSKRFLKELSGMTLIN